MYWCFIVCRPSSMWMRKWFHLFAFLVFLPGIALDPDFTSLVASVTAFLFIVAEVRRENGGRGRWKREGERGEGGERERRKMRSDTSSLFLPYSCVVSSRCGRLVRPCTRSSSHCWTARTLAPSLSLISTSSSASPFLSGSHPSGPTLEVVKIKNFRTKKNYFVLVCYNTLVWSK